MKQVLIALAVMAAMATPAFAQSSRSKERRTPTYYELLMESLRPAPKVEQPRSGSTYDWQSGNSYRWRTDSLGSTRVDGTNYRTGSMWNTTIKPNGDMRGTDSNYNSWSYSSRSKTYMNYGTGEICVGEGYARICS